MRGIYKLLHKVNHDKFYIGSSQDIIERFRKHKTCTKNEKFKCTLYRELRADGIDNYSLEIIEEIPDSTLMELKEKEQHYIKQLKPSLNMRAAYLTAEEKYEMRKKIWTERNKKKITCECGCIVGKAHIARHKKSKKHCIKMIEIKTDELTNLYDGIGISGGFGFYVADLPITDTEPPTDTAIFTPTVLNTSNDEA